MGFSIRKSVSIDDGAGFTVAGNLSAESEQRQSFEKVIAPGATNLEIAVAFSEASLVAFALSSNIALTVKTNSSGAPQETFSLLPGEPVTWIEGETAGKPIAGNVTKIFVTNPSGSESATLKLIVASSL